MLASWFRLKYPHVALGAVASSAPILYFDGIAPKFGYYSVVTKDFKVINNQLYKTFGLFNLRFLKPFLKIVFENSKNIILLFFKKN